MSENHRFRRNKKNISQCQFCKSTLKGFAKAKETYPNMSLWCKKRYRKQQFVKRIDEWLNMF